MITGKKMVLVMVFITMCVVAVLAQTESRSFYVSANGDDENNNGRSEDAPYKTLQQAIDVASKGAIKKVTILGTLNETVRINDSGQNEIVIAGKKNQTADDKAVIISDSQESVIEISGNSNIRFEYVDIINNDTWSGATNKATGITINGNGKTQVTLSMGTKIIKCRGRGVYNVNGILTMSGDALISENRGGIYIWKGGTLTMLNNSAINENTFTGNGAGVYIESGKLVMQDNAQISKNILEGGSGAGVYIIYSTFLMKNNASIIDNKLIGNNCNGAGVYIKRGSNTITDYYFLIQDNGKISGNIIEGRNSHGGGVYIDKSGTRNTRDPIDSKAYVRFEGKASIIGNKASQGGGLYINSQSSDPFVLVLGNISNNNAEFGAGIYFSGKTPVNFTAPSGETLVLIGGSLTKNNADFVGGGVYISEKCAFTNKNASITGNTAGDGDGENIFEVK